MVLWMAVVAGRGGVCAGQSPQEPDTLRIPVEKEGVPPVRSGVFVADSLIRDTLRYEYAGIKNAAYKSSFTKNLYKLFFVNPKKNRVNVMRTQNSEERFRVYAGKVIEDIRIVVLPPFGVSVYDTSFVEVDAGWIQRKANAIHIKTAERVIEKQLTLKRGMAVEPFEVVQNEVLLRRLDNVDDATITITDDPDHPGGVVLMVVCRDDFSWGADFSTNFTSKVKVGVSNQNLFRLGHTLKYTFSYHKHQEKRYGNTLCYWINSLFGTHVDLMAYYQNDYSIKEVAGRLERPFLTSSIKWGGGLTLKRVYWDDDMPDINIVHQSEPFNYHAADFWIGHSFRLKEQQDYNRNLYLTWRFINTIFNHRPEVSADTNHFYYDRRTYFLSCVFRKLKYYKANLIYDFGRTEDIPSGFYSALTIGYENNDFDDSAYIGYEIRLSHFNFTTERLYSFDFGIGSYANKDGFERGLLRTGFHHISNLMAVGSWRFRFYGDLSYAVGLRRYPGDYLYMQDRDILGFDSDTLRGNQKLSTSLSTTFFMPYIKKGFRAALTAFADVGVMVPRREAFFKSRAYWGLGVALNLRNDNIVLKNICIRFSVYPSAPTDMREFQSSMSGKLQNGFYDFQIRKPCVISDSYDVERLSRNLRR